MIHLSRIDVAQTARSVSGGGTSAVAIAREAIERLAAYHRVQPHVWISRFDDDALVAAAGRIDERVAAGERLPLAGVPFAVKDNIDVVGLATTAACPAFAYHPAGSATVVERLIAAGALCIGKTNLDQFATGLVGTRSPYGIPRNAYNLAYVSGGSSSGSAVAVAAGLVGFAIGTDTAGSGRVPAAFNHLVGLKPTRGRWSTRGLVPACRTLDCITAFAGSIADVRLIDEVCAGFDPHDPFSRIVEDRPRAYSRIGVPPAEQLAWFGDTASENLFDRAIRQLEATGARVVPVDLAPLREAARLLYDGPWIAERTAAILPLLRDKPDAVHPVVRQVVEAGLAIGAVEVFDGIYRLAELRRRADGMWDVVDMLALPTTGTIYRVAEVLAAPVALNSNLGIYTNFVNLLDMAAVAVPAGSRANGTGFGLSLIGPSGTDTALLDAAATYLQTAALPPLPPLDLGERMETVKLAVVGAHLKDMPLHWQLTSRGATFVGQARTADDYRLYAIAGSVPPKPALVHAGVGAHIALELYEMSIADFGSFVVDVPSPLAIGTVVLEDGSSVKGFVAEPRALDGAQDITEFGGWRAYIASLG